MHPETYVEPGPEGNIRNRRRHADGEVERARDDEGRERESEKVDGVGGKGPERAIQEDHVEGVVPLWETKVEEYGRRRGQRRRGRT